METTQLCLFMLLCLSVEGWSSETVRRQKRNWIIDSFTIDEGYSGPYPYSLGTVKVEKMLTLFQINGQGVNIEPKGILHINNHTGEITVHGPVDYELFKVLKLDFLALDRDSHLIDTRLGIEIKIIDSNDNPPKFDLEIYHISVKESTIQGTSLITLRATDIDDGKNKMFDLRIVSVSPESDDLEFYLTKASGAQTGTISFKGCLDHEKADKYTIIVEAKDQGEKIQLSSSCTIIISIEDGNNHLPVITGHIGPGKVKEGQENVLISRLQATDEDREGTAAWRVKYQIHAETDNFRITTDNETNEGLLYLNKPLNYEETPVWNVSLSVQNEIPYYSCRVESKSTVGLWKVTTITASTDSSVTPGSSTYKMTVVVDDVNEAPVFDESIKNVALYENVEPGQYLVTFTAKDPDVSSTNQFVYVKGEDPAGWVTVDPKTGKVTTSEIIDRESLFVNESIYRVTIYAVDDGKPPMTSTATLSIHIKDENDNSPSLTVTKIDMCQSDGSWLANITAVDLDEEPYGGPFSFKLHGDVKGRWRLNPAQGYTVILVKENTVHSGHHDLVLEVSDSQGMTALRNLSVTVCNCLDTAKPDCRSRISMDSTVGGGAVFIIIFSILMLAGLLLLAALVSCKRQFKPTQDDGSGQYLKKSNTEEPGTDCKVEFDGLNKGYGPHQEEIKGSKVSVPMLPNTENSGSGREGRSSMSKWGMVVESDAKEINSGRFWFWEKGARYQEASSSMRKESDFMLKRLGGHSKNSHQEHFHIHQRILLQVLDKMMYSLQAPGVELCDYAPHVYAEEGETEHNFELDALSIPDTSFDLDSFLDLDFKFNTLASICMPSESTVYRTQTFYGTEKLQTATLIQVESHSEF